MINNTILFLVQLGGIVLFFCTNLLAQTTWHVGPNQDHLKPSSLVNLVSDGDTILIETAEFLGDVATWHQSDLVIKGLKEGDNIPVLNANNTASEGRAIWVFNGNNIKVKNIKFTNCIIDGAENGAGILFQGQGLSLDSCIFLNNQRHVIVADNIDSHIRFSYCEFAQNQSTQTHVNHLIAIGKVKHFVLEFSYLHHVHLGHHVVSNAAKSDILYNQIADEATGSSSYLLYFPIGGEVYIVGNVLMQGEMTNNKIMINYGLGGLGFKHNVFNFYQNTIIKHYLKGPFIWIGQPILNTKIFNNLLVGDSPLILGTEGMILSNQQIDIGTAAFVNPSVYDYHLTNNSLGLEQAIDYRKMGVRIQPEYEYVHPIERKLRLTANDLGAFELE